MTGQSNEREVVVAEVFRVTYEGNDYEDTFGDLASAESWASQWNNATIHRRVTTTTVERTGWEPVTPPAPTSAEEAPRG